MKQLTIIIPHFESIDMLKKLLDSIPKNESIQTIVIDDNSIIEAEKYSSISESEAYTHINFIKNPYQKRSAGICRNIGLEHATGKYILFADSDDFFTDDFFDIVSKYFSKSTDVVFFVPTSIEIDTGLISDRHLKYERLINNYLSNCSRKNELKLKYVFRSPCSKLILRELIIKNDITFDETKVSNDVMFAAKCGYYARSIEVSKQTIYCITKSTGTLTTMINKENFSTRLDVFINYYKYLSEVLSKQDFALLELNPTYYLVSAYNHRFGVLFVIRTWIKFRKNKIRVIKLKYLDVFYLINRVSHYKKERKNNRFLSKP
jgi:glycosyltransferase involved in cell wall biosynthesis